MSRLLDGIVLVTGGSGFIGSAVVRQLKENGANVRILIPPFEKQRINSHDCEYIVGDIRNKISIREALAGVKYVFHIAGDYRLWADNHHDMVSVNVEGTRVLMEEAISANVSLIVHTSSASTIRQNGKTPEDESSLAQEFEADGLYMKSKILADEIVRQLAKTKELPVVTVKPTTVIGPGDYRPTPTGQLVYNAVRGKIPAFVDTKLNISHVEDVAKGFILAFSNGIIGRDYILGGDNVTLQEFLLEVSSAIGTSAPKFKLPAGPLLPLAHANEFLCSVTRQTPFLTVAGLKHAQKGMIYNIERARKELGYTSRPFSETVRSAVDFFVENLLSKKEITSIN